MKHLLLNGFMAVGKSTIGPMVAARLELPFVDLDEEIERRAGKDIGEIFREDGEARFRRLELETTTDLLTREPRVIAGGGGLLQDDRVRAIVEESALVITLTCPVEELARRASNDGPELRPVLFQRLAATGESGLEAIVELLKERSWLYDAYPSVATNGRLPEEAAAVVAEKYLQYEKGENGAVYELPFPGAITSEIIFTSSTAAERLSWLPKDTSLPFALVSDQIVFEKIGRQLSEVISRSGYEIVTATLPAGEESKCLATVEELYERFQDARIDRNSTVLALGGGVIGDIAAFAASTYLRGLPFINVPTTLLAQVDASIGGKTGVDFRGVKNLVGSFHPARRVVVDTNTLKSLPLARLREGLAEMIKIAFVRDPGLLSQIEELSSAGDIVDRPDLIRRAIRNKVEVVKADPYETSGERALLNFGHTVGHAIESAAGYRMSHGECVAMGMVAETELAVCMGTVDSAVAERLKVCLHHVGLPAAVPVDEPAELMRLMRQDKKRVGASIRVVILEDTGRAKLRPVDEDLILSVLGAKAIA